MDSEQLLKDAYSLGQDASQQTGVAFAPETQATSLSRFNAPITSETLASNETPIVLPEPTQSTFAGGISGRSEAILELEGLEDKARQKTLDDQAKLKESQTKSESLLERIGVTKKQVTEEEGGDIPLLNEQKTTARNKLRESQVMELGELKALEGQGLTDVQKAQKRQEISRRHGFTQLEAQLSYYMSTENLASVKETLNDRLTLELEPLYAQLDLQKNVYDQIKDSLSKSEEREWGLAMSKVETSIAEKKELSSYRSEIITTAMQNGNPLPSFVVQELNRANTQEEINQVLARNGISLQDPLDRQSKQATLAEKYQNIAKAKAEANAIANGGASDDLLAYASQYADTGKLPTPAELKLSGLSVGQVTAMAKQTPKPNGALVSTNTGVKSSALSPTQEAGITALSEIVQTTLPNLQKLFPEISTGLLGGLGGMIWTSQKKQDYLTLRQEFLSKLLVARSGAAVTEQEYARYAKLLPTTFNQPFFLGSDGLKKLNSLQSSMVNNLDTVLNTQQLSMYGYSEVKVGGVDRKVGEVLDIGGVQYKVLPDGTLTDIL